MREHLYRAKRVNWRELPKEEWWVEGDILLSDGYYYIIPDFGVSCVEKLNNYVCDKLITLHAFEVDKETVCQYTGLTDKNGRKIFDGYICRDSDNIVRILWNDKHQWGVEISKTDNALSRGLAFPLWQYDNCKENGYRKLEVIGNIFDNLGLLEGGEAE